MTIIIKTKDIGTTKLSWGSCSPTISIIAKPNRKYITAPFMKSATLDRAKVFLNRAAMRPNRTSIPTNVTITCIYQVPKYKEISSIFHLIFRAIPFDQKEGYYYII